MSNQYYVRRGSKISGPAKAERLERSAAKGKLRATDQVSTSQNGPWRTVSQVPSLASHLQGAPQLDATFEVAPGSAGQTLGGPSADRVESTSIQKQSAPEKTLSDANLPSGETAADLGATVDVPRGLSDNTASGAAEESRGQTVDVPTMPSGETAADLGATVDSLRGLSDHTVSEEVEEPLGQTVDVPTTPTGQSQAPEGDAETGQAPTPRREMASDRATRHTVTRFLAEGGLGKVYVAQDDKLQREVVMKTLKDAGGESSEARYRFVQEAQVNSQLEHPNIIPIYQAGDGADGQPYYTMKYVRGQEYRDLIQGYHQNRREGNVDALELRRLLTLFISTCQAVSYAHNRGVVHRDIKPENVAVGEFGELMVLDWGLAKVLGEPDTETSRAAVSVADEIDLGQTIQGRIMGTPGYMAPEQASGETDAIEPRTDVYSLGAMLFEILTGEAPHALLHRYDPNQIQRWQRRESHSGTAAGQESVSSLASQHSSGQHENTMKLLARVIAGTVPAPSDIEPTVPRALDAICQRAMRLKIEDRYTTASDLAADVERWLADEPVTVYAGSWNERLGRWMRKHRTKVQAIGASFAVIALVAVVSSVLINNQRQLAVAKTAQAERNAYTSDMLLASFDWEDANLGRLRETLDRHRERPDLKGFEWGYWDRLKSNHLLALKGHTGPVFSVSFSPDGTRLASGSMDGTVKGTGTVKVWDAATGQETRTLQGHTGPDPFRGLSSLSDALALSGSFNVCFSADGKRIASASNDMTVKVWDVATGQVTRTLQGHTRHIRFVSFSADGTLLASASLDGTVKLWDVATGQVTLTLGVPNPPTARKLTQTEFIPITGASFTPDGKRIATAMQDGTVRVWNVVTGQQTLTLKGRRTVITVSFSPDGKWLASASEDITGDATVKVWDAVTGAQMHVLKGHTAAVNSVSFSPDGTKLASASRDSTVKLWDTATGQEIHTLKGHSASVMSVSFSPDGRRLATASKDGMVKIWDAATDDETLTLKASARHAVRLGGTYLFPFVSFSQDGTQLAFPGRSGAVGLWDSTTGQVTRLLQAGDRGAAVWSVHYSPDGTKLASASFDKTVKVWDVATGQKTLTLGHTKRVFSVCFSPDGRRLATAGENGMVKVWDAATGQELLTIEHPTDLKLDGHPVPVYSVCFSPDGRQVASASMEPIVKLWDAATGQELLTFKGHTKSVMSVSFSPDGTRLASGSMDGTVKVWDAATGQETRTLQGHTQSVTCVRFSPDGKRLASASWDKTVRVWDAATGQEFLTLKGHTARVASVSFSPDGKRLASASYDQTVKVWDARPWTPELRAQSQARGLLTLRRSQVASLDALQAVIRSDQTISDPVRQQAIKWSALFWTGRVGIFSGPKSASLAPRGSWPVEELKKIGAKIGRNKKKEVVQVNLHSRRINDATLVHLKGITKLKTLILNSTRITDVGLAHLKGLTNLETLSLRRTQITGAGLVHLKDLTNLEGLFLDHTLVADKSLIHLKGLTNLQQLSLDDTPVTAAGVTELQQALPNCKIITAAGVNSFATAALQRLGAKFSTTYQGDVQGIDLAKTQVTDAGLEHLKGLTNLRSLNLTGTQVTDAGLVHLKGLTELRALYLTDTKVTAAGIAELQKALPNCKIEPAANATPQPAASATPQPAASATPQADASATPQPAASATPQADASATPQADASATPQADAATAKQTLTPAQLAVGDPIENSIGMVLVPIPAGEFLMGSPETEPGRKESEVQHQVTLTKPFLLGVHEVTQGQWQAVMGTTPWKGKYMFKKGDDYPATWLTWQDAAEFCRKLSEKEGLEYRLPTEAEWEYACRAGTKTAYSFGDDASEIGEYAWYRTNASDRGPKHPKTVGQKKPNPWGLYDMHGNMTEWCSDWWGAYPSGSVTDPTGPASGQNGVRRGGSWFYVAGFCRSAFRLRDAPSNRDGDHGFRVALTPSGQKASPNRRIITDAGVNSFATAALQRLGAKISTTNRGDVQGVELTKTQVTDAGLVHLVGLSNLEQLYLNDTPITDAGMVHLKGLAKLKQLNLMYTKITDAGLVHLKGLTNLRQLLLSNTQVTDAGLIHLKEMTNLRQLFLSFTQVTDAGLVHLKGLTNITTINLRETKVTDAGLVHLKGMTNLHGLNLRETKVTDAGVAALQKVLPNCKIRRY